MRVKISRNDRGNPPGKLADAEIHFETGPLAGLKLIGFGIWERRNGAGRTVTFPARQYSVNGERRSFALLRPLVDGLAQDRVRDLILKAYADHEEQEATSENPGIEQAPAARKTPQPFKWADDPKPAAPPEPRLDF